MHDAQFHLFSDSVFCMGREAMNEPEVKVTIRWSDYLEQHKGSARRIDGETIQDISWQKDGRDRERDR